ncbi:MAG: DUF805 domain-containing protein, partial [Actinomycetia bacterium]|nr:DUF805 domain-containing protein [Actinomycetes bacterium]
MESSAVNNKNIFDWYLDPWKKFAVGKGRARRKEYWLFYLGNFIIAIVLGAMDSALIGVGNFGAFSPLYSIFELATVIPTIAVGIRRMHDTDHSGWWILFPIVNLVFLLINSQAGENKYGANPKGIGNTLTPSATKTSTTEKIEELEKLKEDGTTSSEAFKETSAKIRELAKL